MTRTLPKENIIVEEAVFTVDAQWRINSFNKSAEAILGMSAGELLGKNCRDIFNTSEKFDELCNLYGPLASGRAMHDLRLVVSASGQKENIVVLVNAIPLPDEKGNLTGAVISMRDAADASLPSRLLMDSIADGVFTVDRKLRITGFNKAAEQITGFSRSEVIGQPHGKILKCLTSETCFLEECMKNGTPMSRRSIFIYSKSGGTIPISLTASPIVDSTGSIIGGVETFKDLTSNLQRVLILDSIADAVFSVDQDMRITTFNRAAEHITGWSMDEVIGKPCHEIFHSNLCGESCILAKSVEIGKTIFSPHTVFIKRKDGQTTPISISCSPIINPIGEIIGGVETFQDVTNTIQQDLILDSIADGVFTVDRNWKITSFNRAAEMITGWSRDEALGKSCSDVFHSSICGDDCAIAKSLYSGKPVANRSIFIRNNKNEQVPISISAAPLLDHEGNIIGGVETFRDLSIITELRKQLNKRYTYGEIISKSPAMQKIFNILPDIAHSDSNVLILGESGTGKEVMARAIYGSSKRNKHPFIAVNCGALPETLLESELFGYKAGAFTDAKQDRPGRFAAAEKGTLFLDEIGDIPPSLQVKLLRVLQEKVYEPLGSNKPVKADVRIITATNKDLQSLVKQGLFREDLFYRLNVVKIHLPKLNERMEDIPMLIEHFIKKFSAQQGKDIVGISDSALNILMHYEYPGNIRELENIIEYAFILCQGGFIQPEHLPEPFSPDMDFEEPCTLIPGKVLTLEDMEKSAIYQALERNSWKKLATCRELGISKDTLRRKIQRYKLKSPLDILSED